MATPHAGSSLTPHRCAIVAIVVLVASSALVRAEPLDAGPGPGPSSDTGIADVFDKETGYHNDCGDGVLDRDGWETCDGEHWIFGYDPPYECSRLGYDAGVLGCAENCQFDISACIGAVCGDLRVDEPEMCDSGGDPEPDRCPYGDTECTWCDADCTLHPGGTSWCGDGVIDPRHEDCDGRTWPGGIDETCESVGGTGPGVRCTECVLDASMCDGGTCGDGIQTGGEACDDGNTDLELCPRGHRVCEVCGPECTRVPGLTNACGDGVLQRTEACESSLPTTCIDGCGVEVDVECVDCRIVSYPCRSPCGADDAGTDSDSVPVPPSDGTGRGCSLTPGGANPPLGAALGAVLGLVALGARRRIRDPGRHGQGASRSTVQPSSPRR